MIGPILLVARVSLRRRLRRLLGIVLLAAVFGAASLGALVGAQRTATSLDRFHEWAHSSDVEFQGDSVERAEAIRETLDSDPAVRQTSLRYLANAFPISEETTLPDIAVLSDPAGQYGVTIDRVRVIEGRMPDAGAPYEVILNEVAAALLDVGPGDRLPVLTFGGDDLDVLGRGAAFPGFNGPQVDLEVVGIGRAPRDLPGELRRTDLIALASPGFLAADPDNPVAAWPPTVMTRFVDFDRDFDQVSARVGALGPLGGDGAYHPTVTSAADEYVDATQRSIDGMAIALLIFAGVATATGALATGQAARREARASTQADATLAALGMDRRARTVAIAVPVFVAELVGIVAGAGLAVVATPLLPRGRARLAEIEPGVWLDAPVLAAGLLTLLVLAAAVAAWAAGRETRRMAAPTLVRRGPLADRVVALFGLSAVTATGLRRAGLTRGNGSTLARSAVSGVAVAIAGIVATGVVVRSIDALESDPANWGWTWTTKPDAFGGDDPMPQVAADPDVASVGILSAGSVVADGQGLQGMSLTAHKGDLAFTLLRGRLPSSAAEVALGTQTLHDLEASIGDALDVMVSDGTANTSLQIVGTVVLPPTELATLDEGAVFTPDGLARVAQGPPSPELVIGYREGVDAPALERRLGDTAGLTFPVFARANVPGSITTVAQASGVAWSLAVFFSIIGIVGLFNALTTSVRREGHDLAILRALGFRGREVRRATLVQALTMSIVGLVIGVPVGLVAGRSVWRGVSGGLGIAADPRVPWLLVWTILPATVAVTVVLCWWPGRYAARSRPAVQLRAE